MKLRTARYIVKEGVLNIYKNKLMSLASICIIIASLLLFGIFLLIVLNLDHNTRTLESIPQLEIFCDYRLDETLVKDIEQAIREDDRISEYRMVTKKEAFEKLKEKFKGEEDILEGYDESFLPVSFIVKLQDPQDSNAIKEKFEKMNKVDSVECPQKSIELISKASSWIKVISGILIAVLLVTSTIIISNTIKLTVFARRKEISIMKYIGATDWFIRWPFIVEGVIIGIIGAIAALILSSYGYREVELRLGKDLTSVSMGFFEMLKFKDVALILVLFYSFLGCIVGAIGSVMSLRKHLRV